AVRVADRGRGGRVRAARAGRVGRAREARRPRRAALGQAAPGRAGGRARAAPARLPGRAGRPPRPAAREARGRPVRPLRLLRRPDRERSRSCREARRTRPRGRLRAGVGKPARRRGGGRLMLRPADLVTSIARETQMHLTRIRVKCTMDGVLSVAKLTPGQERYYEKSVAAGIDDYYAGRGESPGIWTGRGSAALGLEGVVEDGQLGTLIRGDSPVSGQKLRRRHPKARTITVEKINPATGERRLEGKTLRPAAGLDLVFSVPKSVSLLPALGDADPRRAVNEAHTVAWQAALAYLEDEACVVRRGTGGVGREQGEGFVAAAYQHRTSRAQDPHLHTHVIVGNMARRPSDGKWRGGGGGARPHSHPRPPPRPLPPPPHPRR